MEQAGAAPGGLWQVDPAARNSAVVARRGRMPRRRPVRPCAGCRRRRLDPPWRGWPGRMRCRPGRARQCHRARDAGRCFGIGFGNRSQVQRWAARGRRLAGGRDNGRAAGGRCGGVGRGDQRRHQAGGEKAACQQPQVPVPPHRNGRQAGRGSVAGAARAGAGGMHNGKLNDNDSHVHTHARCPDRRRAGWVSRGRRGPRCRRSRA